MTPAASGRSAVTTVPAVQAPQLSTRAPSDVVEVGAMVPARGLTVVMLVGCKTGPLTAVRFNEPIVGHAMLLEQPGSLVELLAVMSGDGIRSAAYCEQARQAQMEGTDVSEVHCLPAKLERR